MRRVAALLLFVAAPLQASPLTDVDANAASTVAPGAVVLDVRPAERCVARSLAGARCLPAQELVDAHRQLPAWRDVLWRLSLAGLDGSESVLVIGDVSQSRDFVAALLYLAGQREVRVARDGVEAWLARGRTTGTGAARPLARRMAYTARMREELIVLPHEIGNGVFLLDVRTPAEYWGETIRASRGGHLPGAQSLPATEFERLPLMLTALPRAAVVYGHDAVDGLAAFTRLVAGHGLDTRVMPAGFAEWAQHGDWPVDAQSLPDARPDPYRMTTPPKEDRSRLGTWLWPIAGAMLAAVTGFWLGRRRA